MFLDPTLDNENRKTFKKYITAFLQNADFGVCDLNVEAAKLSEAKAWKELPAELREKLLSEHKNPVYPKVEMLHNSTNKQKKIPLPFEEESNGTQRFFNLIGPWIQAVSQGMTVFADELETSLHPLLTRELIKFFQKIPQFGKPSQLVFATHDTTLLDPELFRRDQIWFTEKDQFGGTNLYSMLDYKERPARKGEAMQKGYLSGRYGAIPVLKSFELI